MPQVKKHLHDVLQHFDSDWASIWRLSLISRQFIFFTLHCRSFVKAEASSLIKCSFSPKVRHKIFYQTLATASSVHKKLLRKGSNKERKKEWNAACHTHQSIHQISWKELLPHFTLFKFILAKSHFLLPKKNTFRSYFLFGFLSF